MFNKSQTAGQSRSPHHKKMLSSTSPYTSVSILTVQLQARGMDVIWCKWWTWKGVLCEICQPFPKAIPLFLIASGATLYAYWIFTTFIGMLQLHEYSEVQSPLKVQAG